MKRKTFSILFYINKGKLSKKTGETTIVTRITVNGVQAEFQTQRTVNPTHWNQAKGRVTSRDQSAIEVNNYLDSVRVKLYEIQKQIEDDHGQVSAQLIKHLYLGTSPGSEKDRTILALFKDHNNKMNELVGKEFSQKTADRYDTTYRHIAEFMKNEYMRNDMMIYEVDYNFIDRYDHWLKTKKRCNQNSSIKHLKALKKVLFIAMRNGWIKHNPFKNYKLKEEPVDKQFLTENELITR